MKRLLLLLILPIVAGIFFFTGCEKLEYKELDVLESRAATGRNDLIIVTKEVDGDTIRGPYRIEIFGPFGFSFNVIHTGQEYRLFDVPPGNYKISVSKVGYIGSTKFIEFEGVAGEGSEDYIWRLNMRMSPKSLCAVIPQTGGRYIIAALNNNSPGIGRRAGIVTVPAFTFDGPTEMCITAVPSEYEWGDVDKVAPNGKHGSYMLVCEPSGLDFLFPMPTQLPLDLPGPLQGIPFDIAYKTGPVPTADFEFSQDPGDIIPIQVQPGGADGLTSIPHFSAWQIVGNYRIEYDTFDSKRIRYFGRCSDDLKVEYDTIGDFGPIFRSVFNLPVDSFPRVREQLIMPGDRNFLVDAQMYHTRLRYNIITIAPRPDTIEQGEFPIYPLHNIWRRVACHNSGGGGG